MLGPRTDELIIEDAEPQDRVLVPTSAEARYEMDGRTPNDLLIRAGGAEGSDALIRVLGFREGDLGLSLKITDKPLLYPDADAFGYPQAEAADVASISPVWWWDEARSAESTHAVGPASWGAAVHAMGLVYDGGHAYPDGCNADDPDPCSW